MKTILSFSIAVCTFASAAFAGDLAVTIVQDPHGGTRVMYFDTQEPATSIALFANGSAISTMRETPSGDLQAMTTTDQHGRSVTRYQQLQ